MSRATWRVLRIELLRGTAPVAAGALVVAGVTLLVAQPEAWSARWVPLAEQLRVLMMVLCPLATTAGAWQAGRERRRRIDDLLAATPRTYWQRITLTWGAVTLGTFAGFLATWLVGAAMVAPVATYAGRGWWWTLAVGLTGLGVSSAIGVVIGRVVPWRAAAPLSGALLLVGMISSWLALSDRSSGVSWLLPTIDSPTYGTKYLPTSVQLLQFGWFSALTVMLLMLVSVRRWWLIAMPAAIAAAAAVPIATGPGDGRWEDDPTARELVCGNAGGTELCLTRVNAFLMDEVSTLVEGALARWDHVDRVVDFLWLTDPDNQLGERPDTAFIQLEEFVTWGGKLSMADQGMSFFNGEVAYAVTDLLCPDSDVPGGQVRSDLPSMAVEASYVAQEWVFARRAGDARAVDSQLGTLLAWPESRQDAWFSRYVTAARSCDTGTLAELVEELA